MPKASQLASRGLSEERHPRLTPPNVFIPKGWHPSGQLENRICFGDEDALVLGMKLSRLWMLIAASALASGAWARDITTTTGEVYHNAVVTKVQPDGIRIVHDDGAGFLNFQVLKDPDRREFGFDPVAYAAAEKDDADFEKRMRDLRFQAAQVALAAKKKAAEAAAAAYAAQAPLAPWPTTMDVGVQTPGFSYNTFGSSGWVSWPYVPSTYISSPAWGGGYRSSSIGRFGGGFGGAGFSSAVGGRR